MTLFAVCVFCTTPVAAAPKADSYYGKTKVAPMAQVKACPFDLGQAKLLPSPFGLGLDEQTCACLLLFLQIVCSNCPMLGVIF